MDSEDLALPPLTLGRNLWAIRGDVLPRIVEAHRGAEAFARLTSRMGGKAPQAARRTSSTRAAGAVAVLPLTGVLTPRGSFLSMLFGGGAGGLMDFRETFQQAVADPDVGAIVLDVDSPGGLIDLVPETAEEVRAARGQKPIVAVANTLAASGAYWIAAQADELVVTPSGDVGSIGVYVMHEDWSGFNEQTGIDVTYISAGKYKTEGNIDEPLSDEAREAWQSEVDDLYTMFVDSVAAGRNVTSDTVIADYGEGRTLLAARSLKAGMVDRVATLEQVVGEFLGAGGSGRGERALAQARRVVSSEPLEQEEPVDGPTDSEPEVAEPAVEVDDEPPAVDDPEPAEGDEAGAPAESAPSDADRVAIAAALIG